MVRCSGAWHVRPSHCDTGYNRSEPNNDQITSPLPLRHSPPTAHPSRAMMLVQKQPHFSMSLAASPYLYTHRRHPSAPPVAAAVVVQPTRTPGLLSVSRKDHRASPKPRQPLPVVRSPRPAPAEAVAPLKPAPEIRGRQQQGKRVPQHQQRSSSQAAPSRRRQPSPDPFKTTAVAAPPPNKRRQPIPVPQKAPVVSDTSALSQSDPVLSHMPRRKPQRATTHDIFPICDDMTDAGSRPSTPTPRSRPELRLSEPRTPTRRSRLPEPPLTAPVSSGATPSSFPFPTTSTPNSSPKRRPATAARRAKHLSEGVLLPVSFQDSPFAPTRRSHSTERQDPDAPVDPNALLFASSMFQNSPSPDELPPPLFA
ncbi:hypothetical protein C8F01DRAFT_775705 [Mycena amicta]|nr:hypothetical protein C8F01DRAFT_775705 [Mycena amicta]